MTDQVDHPAHYNAHPSGVECIDVVEHMSFNLGNAVKYIWRAGLKSDNPRQDLEKARWYVDRELQRITAAECFKCLHTHGSAAVCGFQFEAYPPIPPVTCGCTG